jgi:hypothetical protein
LVRPWWFGEKLFFVHHSFGSRVFEYESPLQQRNDRAQATKKSLKSDIIFSPITPMQVLIFSIKNISKNDCRDLVETKMINGNINLKISKEIAKLPEWRGPLELEIFSKPVNEDEILLEKKVESRVFFSLKHGLMDGLVIMLGVYSVDPSSLCSSQSFDGIGFIGRFKNGLETGNCWRGLIGGAWIHGEVDSEGHFTGNL